MQYNNKRYSYKIDLQNPSKKEAYLLLWNNRSFIQRKEKLVSFNYKPNISDNERNRKMRKLDSLLASDI